MLSNINLNMKNLLARLSLFLFIVASHTLYGQIYNGDINLSTQGSVDSFPINYGCNIIDGQLNISNVNNIDSLYLIEKIYNDLYITNSTITNLDGLNNLDSIGYYMTINLVAIQRLDAELPNLKHLESLDINGVDTLSGFNSLVTLQDLSTYCAFDNCFNSLVNSSINFLFNNSSITNSFNLLNDITYLDIDATIIDNSFNSLDGLNNLEINAPIVKNSFNNLVSCNDLRLENFDSIQTSFIVITTIIDELEIWNTSLENLNFLQNLVSVSSLTLSNNHVLKSISALSNLNPTALNDLNIYSNDSLSFCPILPFCTYLNNATNSNYIFSNNCGCNSKDEILQNCLATPTSNNECELSTPISIDTICSFFTALNNTNFSPMVAPQPSCGNYMGSDFWYKFSTPASGNIKIDYSFTCPDFHVALYQGACGGLTEVSCESVTPVKEYFGLTPNTTHYLRYWDANNDENGTLEFCISALHIPPVNDDCANAIDILFSDTLCNNIINGTTKGATPDESGFCAISNPKKVYYKLTAPASANYMLNLTNNNQPITIEVYEGNCTSNNHLYCTNGDVILLNENVDYLLAIYTNDIYSYSPFSLCIEYYDFVGNPGALGINIINPIQTLQVNGGIAIANTNVNVPGSIRFNGSNFQGYTSSGWKTFVSYTSFQDPNDPSDNKYFKTSPQSDELQTVHPMAGNETVESQQKETRTPKEVQESSPVSKEIKLERPREKLTIHDQIFLNIISSNPLTEISLSDGIYQGQLIYITCQENTLIIKDRPNTNINLPSDRSIGVDDVLTLIWSGKKWLEVQFSDN